MNTEEIRRLRAAITPGEWARFQKTLTDADPLDEDQPLGEASVECITDIEQDGGHMVVTIAPMVLSNADAEFIAAAPAIVDAYLVLLTDEASVEEWSEAMDAERARQIADGYDDAHDATHGVEHLLNWAIDYDRRGNSLAAATMTRCALRLLAPQPKDGES